MTQIDQDALREALDFHDKGWTPWTEERELFTAAARAHLDCLTAAKPQPASEDKTFLRTDAERDWPEDSKHENGNYFCKCCYCGNQFVGHKRRVVCRACASQKPHSLSDTGLSDEMRGKLVEGITGLLFGHDGRCFSETSDAVLQHIESNYTLIPKGKR